jgi:hypothetical protein
VDKRGRKARGAKIISRHEELGNYQSGITPAAAMGQGIGGHVILHLKCSLEDLREYNLEKKRMFVFNDPLKYDPDVPVAPDIVTSYNDCDNIIFAAYEDEPRDDSADQEMTSTTPPPDAEKLCVRCHETIVREEESKEKR